MEEEKKEENEIVNEEEKEDDVDPDFLNETNVIDEENIDTHLKDGEYSFSRWLPILILTIILIISIIILVIIRSVNGGE